MGQVVEVMQSYYFGGLLLAIIVILFIIVVVLAIKLNGLGKRVNGLVGEEADSSSIESSLKQYYINFEDIRGKFEKAEKDNNENFSKINSRVDKVSEIAFSSIHNVGLVRYNPYEDVGGDFSFALALLDANKNGVVLNSIYNRDGSYFYGKALINGESTVELSKEEKEAVQIAMTAKK